MGFPGGSEGKSVCLQYERPRFDPWVGQIPWRRKWQPTPVLLPGKSHGQRSLVGYSPWGHKESDATEQLHFHFLSLWITEKAREFQNFDFCLIDYDKAFDCMDHNKLGEILKELGIPGNLTCLL